MSLEVSTTKKNLQTSIIRKQERESEKKTVRGDVTKSPQRKIHKHEIGAVEFRDQFLHHLAGAGVHSRHLVHCEVDDGY